MELDLSRYCDREIHCSCGHTHYCPISKVVVEKGALKKIPALLSDYAHVFLVADENTWEACGRNVLRELGEKTNGKLIFHRSGHLVPDERAVEELKRAMPADTDLVFGVGSGVINDICKFTTFERNMPYVIAATAPSMDGYASSGAAMITNGMKVTYTTRPPRMIIADVDVLKNAPIEMIRAGYGDIIGKYSALNDWQLSRLVNGEYFCGEIHDLVMQVTRDIRSSAGQILAREDMAIRDLTEALILIGITLSLLGSTRPGSGSEHHLSHFFEITGLVHNKPYFPHGTDVAYSTVVTAEMRERIARMETPVFSMESEEKRGQAWKRVFGRITPEIEELQKKAGSYENDRTGVYTRNWSEIRRILSACPTGDQVRQMLLEAGYCLEDFEKMYGADKIHDAMLYGKDLKDRYSVLWLYYALFSGNTDAV